MPWLTVYYGQPRHTDYSPMLQDMSVASTDSFPFLYATKGSGMAAVRGRYQGCWDWLKGPASAVSMVPRVSPERVRGKETELSEIAVNNKRGREERV